MQNKKAKSRYGIDGLAEFYVQLKKRGYKRSHKTMVKQISKMPKEKKKIYKHEEIKDQYPGNKVRECAMCDI